MIGIYKITSPSGRVYIGQSKDLIRRKKDYEKYIKNSNRQVKLLASINKYTWEKHFFEIIEECVFNDLNIRERFWQEYYNSVEKGLNCIYTKTNEKPSVFGSETKEKMKIAQTGSKKSKMTKEKMSKIRIGYKFTEEAKLKMSNSRKGIKYSKETIDKMKVVASKRNLKPISCLCPNNTYFEFDSFKEAALHIGVKPQSIQQAVSKNRPCKEWKNFKLIQIVKQQTHATTN
jgi:group I intron endonuclease